MPEHISHLTSLQATIIAVAGWLLKWDSRKTAKFVLHLPVAVAVSANCYPFFPVLFWQHFSESRVWRLDFFLFNGILLGAAPTTCKGAAKERQSGGGAMGLRCEVSTAVLLSPLQLSIMVSAISSDRKQRSSLVPRRTIVLACQRRKH